MNKKNAIFISAGKNEDLASHVLKYDKDNFDIYINIYENCINQSFIEKYATKCFYIKGTKFPILKKIYDEYLKNYDVVAVLDDDGILTHGSISDLPKYLDRYNLDIVSPCQHPYGKLSVVISEVMRYYNGDHNIRITNYVEMNFPVFRNTALKKYMDTYNGKLCGWGNDWWYCNVLETDKRDCCGLVDKVVIYNPDCHQKKFKNEGYNITDIDMYMPRIDRLQQWLEIKEKYGLSEWPLKNKQFVK